MDRRFYGTRGTACALLAAALGASGCGDAGAPAPPRAALDPRKADAAARAVEQYMGSQRPLDAVKVAERLAAEAPDSMRAQELLGRALVAVGTDAAVAAPDRHAALERAVDAYGRAAALDPRNAALRHAAGVVCDTARMHDRAAGFYAEAHAIEPGNGQYAMYLGLACARQGRIDEARALLESSEAAMPEAADPKAALADLAMRAGDLDAALRKVAEARALDPGSEGLRLADARMRRLAGRPRESLELLMPLDPPVRRQPGFADEIAEATAALGDVRSAAVILEESALAAPADAGRALRVARAWTRAGDPIKAAMWAETASLSGAAAEDVTAALRPDGSAQPAPAVEPKH
jgi:tetratricopeptide (TPR) repeat protein